MGQALYRAHRPKKLSEVVGQEHVTTALARSLEKGTIAHAYLFTGPRGTGKTSIARILAHEINGLPYEDDSMHLDIIEIDAASNRRIDEIRELRDKVHIAPTSAKYKVYIIDEVHMLTKEAFNALLKTLEEPPAHVVFMLATTEAHKLPETIISRTQRFSLKPVVQDKVIDHLKSIAKAENVQIDDDALALIAAHGEGSFRDSISLLDQVRNNADKVTLASVQAALGIAPKEVIDSLIAAVAAHDAPLVVQLFGQAHVAGHEPARMAKQLGETLRTQLLVKNAPLPFDQLLALLAKLIEVPSSGNPRANLEVALLDTTLAGAPTTTPKPMPAAVEAKPAVQIDPHPALARKRAAEITAAQGASAATLDSEESTVAEPERLSERPAQSNGLSDSLSARERSSESSVADSEPQKDDASSNNPEGDSINPAAWPEIVAAIKQKHNTLYGIIKTVRPHFEPGLVTLECAYAFHQKKLNEKPSKEKLSNIIQAITGHNIGVTSIVGEALKPGEASQMPQALPPAEEKIHTVAAIATTPHKPQSKEVAAISNIFGGAELLES